MGILILLSLPTELQLMVLWELLYFKKDMVHGEVHAAQLRALITSSPEQAAVFRLDARKFYRKLAALDEIAFSNELRQIVFTTIELAHAPNTTKFNLHAFL
jgi:hypothetical protein